MFADNRAALNQEFTAILKDMQGGLGGPVANSNHGIVHDLQTCSPSTSGTSTSSALAIAAYAVLEGVEAVGLWLGNGGPST